MKVLLIVSACVLALATAEPPKYAAPAPYPPSGWRPSGRQFSLPSRAAPQTAYSAPPKEKYGPPPAVYGPPSTEAPTTTDVPTTELPTTTEEATTEVATENPQDNEFSGAGSRALTAQLPVAQGGSGVYYVLLPDGRLQRVAYSTSRDNQEFQRLIAAPEPVNAGFFAVQYEDVQPIQAPVYAYGSPLVRLFK